MNLKKEISLMKNIFDWLKHINTIQNSSLISFSDKDWEVLEFLYDP